MFTLSVWILENTVLVYNQILSAYMTKVTIAGRNTNVHVLHETVVLLWLFEKY